jgi:hypothetical protein
MRQQVSLLRAVRDRYGELRSRSKVASTVLASPRRAFFTLTIAGVLVGFGVYWFRRRGKPRPQQTPPSPNEVRQRETAELYRVLDMALSTRGVPRPSGTPPLTHARSLQLLGHPVAEAALRLTERYLRARFGHEAFSPDERRDFLREARELSRPPREQQLTPAA